MTIADKTLAAMPLEKAQHYAGILAPWLEPFCDRVEIAGSIRRRRPVCNDVDLVCIPKVTKHTSADGELFGREKVTNLLHKFLREYVRGERQAHWEKGHDNPNGEVFILQLPKCQLDIYVATPKTFGVVLLCRTGSKEHNIFLAERAKARGWHWNPQRGLRIYEESLLRTVAATEQEIYSALDLPWIEPENRERDFLLRNFRAVGKEARKE